ncbi:MAG: hypothetical protein ABSF21_00630 [Dehalococcoidia bacterium]
MRLKVFKLKDGKLIYAGIREVREGDAILDGDTSMSEVNLKESRDINAEILKNLSGQEKDDLKQGLRNLGMRDPEAFEALKKSFETLGLSPKAAEIAARGR